MAQITCDVMDDGTIKVDMHGFEGETCLAKLGELVDRFKSHGVDVEIVDQYKQTDMLADMGSHTIRC